MAIKFDYTPHDKQKEIHQACSDQSPNLWTVVCAGRQGGKSRCARMQAILWAWSNPKSIIWYVCPSEGQAKKVFREILMDCAPHNIIKSKIQSRGDIHLMLHNGSKIEFKSAESEENLRGASVHYLILDEMSFIKRETVETVIIPTMGVTGRKILAISTPKGKNFFFELWNRGISEDENFQKDYKSFRFTSADNPLSNKKLLESFKNSLPKEVYNQEFNAEWCDSAAVFINLKECTQDFTMLQQARPGERYYMGCDIALAAKGDYTVITILNHTGQMVYLDRFRGLEEPELRARIVKAYNLFKPNSIVIEENNQGLPIIQSLKRTIPQIVGFYTTNESKSEIINELIAAFSLKQIGILNNVDLIKELEAFIFSFTATGKIQFKAASGFHDDCVMSLAIAWHSYTKATRTGGYSVYGPPDSRVKSSQSELSAFIRSNVLDGLNAYKDDEDVEGKEFIFYQGS